jgi:hypothetical protein
MGCATNLINIFLHQNLEACSLRDPSGHYIQIRRFSSCATHLHQVVDGQSLISNRKISIPTVVVLQGESACTQPCEQQMVCESVQLCERSVMCQSDESEAALIFCLVMVHRCDYTH